MKEFMTYWPFMIPIIIIELALAVTALVHVARHDRYRFGNRIFWIIVVLAVQIIGPILYFTIGREDD